MSPSRPPSAFFLALSLTALTLLVSALPPAAPNAPHPRAPVTPLPTFFPHLRPTAPTDEPPSDQSSIPSPPPPPDDSPTIADDLVSSAEAAISHHADYRSALRLFRLASILGHSGASATAAALLLSSDAHLPRDLRAAVPALRRAAAAAHPDALALLGLLHASGLADRHGLRKSHPLALRYWTVAAAAGNVFASAALAFRYLHGIGLPANCNAAARHYKRAAHAIATDPRYWPTPHNFQYGDPPLASSLMSVGRTRLKESMFAGPAPPNADDVDLFYYHRHLAEAGDSNSMTLLGSLLMTGGLGMRANHQQAREHLRRAADVGHGEAHGLMGHVALREGNYTGAMKHFRYSAAKEERIGHYALGMIFLHGLAGMEKDYSKAAMHFELAAERRHADASFQLGMIYWRGEGREKSVEKAYRHFRDAARLGNIQSKLNLGMILLDGLHPATEKNCPEAVKLFKQVAEQGEWNTLFDLALSAFDRKDMFGSLYRHSQAAHAGIELGQFNAAMILEMSKEGEIPELAHWSRERMIREMRELYDMSGRQNNSKSYLRSGDVSYLEPKDYASALESYNNSARLNNAEGIFSMGMMYANGVGVESDREKALDHLFKASSMDSHSAIAANLAVIGLKTYWWLLDTWEWWAKLGEGTGPSTSDDAKRKAETAKLESQRNSDGSSRKSTSSKRVNTGIAIGDDLALVGGLLVILITVLVVRSKRMLARQPLDMEVASR